MITLRAQNWLNALDVGEPAADGWLAVCPVGDIAEADVRVELARLGHATEDRAGQVSVRYVAPLAKVKADAIAANRAECRARIVARWPEDQQRNAALGILSTEQTDACAAWILAHRLAENAAADRIDTATAETLAAVQEPVWP